MDDRLAAAFKINQIAMCLNKYADDTLQSHFGIRYVHYLTLIGLTYLQPSTQKDLAQFVQLTSAGMLHALRPLEQKGWVCKSVSPHSRRESVITLTPLGHTTYNAINAVLADQLKDILPYDEAEMARLNTTLGQLLNTVQPRRQSDE